MLEVKKMRIGMAAAAGFVVAIVAAGCSRHSSAPASPPTPIAAATPSNAPQTSSLPAPKRLVAYVLPAKGDADAPGQDANGLIAVPIQPTGANPAASAVNALIDAPNSPLPSGTRLLSLKVDHPTKTATVDFSSQFQSNFKGGESHEAQAVNSVLQTLGQFPDVRQVQFLVAGRKIDSLGGNVELDAPLPTPQQNRQIASSTQ